MLHIEPKLVVKCAITLTSFARSGDQQTPKIFIAKDVITQVYKFKSDKSIT